MLKTWIIAALIANLSLTESVHIQMKDQRDPKVEELVSQLEDGLRNDYDFEPGVDMSQISANKVGKKKHHKKKGRKHHSPKDSKDLMVEENQSKDKKQIKKQFLEQGGMNIGTNNAFLVFKRS